MADKKDLPAGALKQRCVGTHPAAASPRAPAAPPAPSGSGLHDRVLLFLRKTSCLGCPPAVVMHNTAGRAVLVALDGAWTPWQLPSCRAGLLPAPPAPPEAGAISSGGGPAPPRLRLNAGPCALCACPCAPSPTEVLSEC